MRRPIIFVTLAGIGAVLAAVIVFSALRKREAEVQQAMGRTVEVVVAAGDIRLGEKIEPAAVKLVRWSRDSLPLGGFTDPQAVIGAYAKGQFVGNEPIVANKLFMGEKTSGVMPLLIPAGMRAMAVAVDEVADIAGFIQPHARVDILVATSGSGQNEQSFSRMVLQNVEVLAVAQEIERVKDEPVVAKVVTLLVTPTEAEKLSLASHDGTLRLAMRNYSDTKIVATNGVTMADLMHSGAVSAVPVMNKQPTVTARARPAHLAPAGPVPLQVEIMRDGRSSEAYSFINSAKVGHTPDRSAQGPPPATAALATPPAPDIEPASPTSAGPMSANPRSASPISATASAPAASASSASANSASISAPPPFDAGASPAANANSGSTEPSAAARPGEPGYVPAPKVYDIK